MPPTSVPSSTFGGTLDLLFHFLASETGLRSVMSASAQVLLATESFEQLKALAMANLTGRAYVQLSDGAEAGKRVPVSGKFDAVAFTEFYDGLAMTRAGAGQPDSSVVAHWIHPFAGRMLFADPEMAAAIVDALNAHHEKFGEHVRNRNLTFLKNSFRAPASVRQALAPQPA